MPQKGKAWKDEQLISAMLSNPSQNAAASEVAVSTRTLQRRMQDPEFRRKFTAAKSDTLRLATTRLVRAADRMAEVLQKIACDKNAPTNARVNAALNCIALAQDAVELESVEDRIARLEDQTHGL